MSHCGKSEAQNERIEQSDLKSRAHKATQRGLPEGDWEAGLSRVKGGVLLEKGGESRDPCEEAWFKKEPR